MHRTLLASLFLLTACLASGCDSADVDDEGPAAPQSVAGVWAGPITHSNPALDGTLELTITQVDRAITGSAAWTTGGGETYRGSLLGTVPASGPVTYTLNLGDRGTYLHDMTLRDGVLSGTWQSERSSSIAGTSTLTRR